jgi:hypothetical protein
MIPFQKHCGRRSVLAFLHGEHVSPSPLSDVRPALARIVTWLNGALLLLILSCNVGHAGSVYVGCNLKADWPPYKTGTHQWFALTALNRGIYDEYQTHCAFANVFDITIDGDIDHTIVSLLASLKNILDSDTYYQKLLGAASTALYISLNSSGGDVDSALTIGRIIRALQARTVVPLPDECVSSCVFLLAGGVDRVVWGMVGVHRPYFPTLSTKLSPDEVSQAYEQQRTLIRKYLNDMNVPSSLLEFMDETPPESVHYLNQIELVKYLLNSVDPIFDERRIARMADVRGLTSSEYRQRVVEENAICGTIESTCNSGTAAQIEQCGMQHLTCTDAVSWGLSIPEYLKHHKEAERCPSLRESASVDAFVACVKAAMLGK